jgi:hypothetical protein
MDRNGYEEIGVDEKSGLLPQQVRNETSEKEDYGSIFIDTIVFLTGRCTRYIVC